MIKKEERKRERERDAWNKRGRRCEPIGLAYNIVSYKYLLLVYVCVSIYAIAKLMDRSCPWLARFGLYHTPLGGFPAIPLTLMIDPLMFDNHLFFFLFLSLFFGSSPFFFHLLSVPRLWRLVWVSGSFHQSTSINCKIQFLGYFYSPNAITVL